MAKPALQFKGLKELEKALETLPAKVSRNILRNALRAGMKPALEYAKSIAPDKTGKLKRSMRIGTKGRRNGAIANIRAGGSHKGVKVFYASWLEFGVKAHTITPKGSGVLSFAGNFLRAVNHPGITARPYMRPALDTQQGAMVKAMAAHMRLALSKKHGLDIPPISFEGDE